MSWTGAVVLFAVIWPLVFFAVLPIRIRSQSEGGQVVPGTPPSAPVDPGLRWKVQVATVGAVVLWGLVAGTIHFDLVTLEDVGVTRH